MFGENEMCNKPECENSFNSNSVDENRQKACEAFTSLESQHEEREEIENSESYHSRTERLDESDDENVPTSDGQYQWQNYEPYKKKRDDDFQVYFQYPSKVEIPKVETLPLPSESVHSRIISIFPQIMYQNCDSESYNEALEFIIVILNSSQPWFHRITATEATILLDKLEEDGVFLVRPNSKKKGFFVLSFRCDGVIQHIQIETMVDANVVSYSLDEGVHKFYNIIQLVEYYQMNEDSNAKLTQYVVAPEKSEIGKNGVEAMASAAIYSVIDGIEKKIRLLITPFSWMKSSLFIIAVFKIFKLAV